VRRLGPRDRVPQQIDGVAHPAEDLVDILTVIGAFRMSARRMIYGFSSSNIIIINNIKFFKILHARLDDGASQLPEEPEAGAERLVESFSITGFGKLDVLAAEIEPCILQALFRGLQESLRVRDDLAQVFDADAHGVAPLIAARRPAAGATGPPGTPGLMAG